MHRYICRDIYLLFDLKKNYYLVSYLKFIFRRQSQPRRKEDQIGQAILEDIYKGFINSISSFLYCVLIIFSFN